MPSALTYPGVYIEEIPSGVRTIVGVGTSIAAFVGRAEFGPVNRPIVINGYTDFERRFGGIWTGSKLGYAVRDFFLNGGSQAIIVRLFGFETEAAKKGKENANVKVDGLDLVATDAGEWGKKLRLAIDVDVSEITAKAMDLTIDKLFNLTVRDIGGGETEQLRNVTMEDRPRRIDRVLLSELTLVRWNGDFPNPAPAVPKVGVAHAKRKSLSDATKKLADAKQANPPVQADIDAAATAVETAQKQLDQALDDLVDPATKAEKQLAAAEAKDPQVPADINTAKTALKNALAGFNGSDGLPLSVNDFIGVGKQGRKEGLYALDDADLFNLLCIPPYNVNNDVDKSLVTEAAQYCERRRAMLLVDPPSNWGDKEAAKAGVGGIGTNSKNAALFFPRLQQPDQLLGGRIDSFVPCGAVAGIFARTDSTRGVWKAPAGFEATLVGVPQLSVPLTDGENGELNPLGINCLRSMPAAGRIVWGSRTLQGDDRLASEWKYIPVRRTALFIEESLYRGTQWVVFEPNDEPLWAQIRLNVGAFMNDLFRQGAFQGQTPRDAYFVKCSSETTTQNDINKGIVNILVGFAPLKPAEFVVVKLQQIAGQIQT